MSHLSTFNIYRVVYSGDEGARTPDLDSAIVALFQLSYIPLTDKIIPYRPHLVNPFWDRFCLFLAKEGHFGKIAWLLGEMAPYDYQGILYLKV